jgi:hypothetical protein
VAQLYPQAPGTHFSRLLRHARATAGLFFLPVTTRGTPIDIRVDICVRDIDTNIDMSVQCINFVNISVQYVGILYVYEC